MKKNCSKDKKFEKEIKEANLAVKKAKKEVVEAEEAVDLAQKEVVDAFCVSSGKTKKNLASAVRDLEKAVSLVSESIESTSEAEFKVKESRKKKK